MREPVLPLALYGEQDGLVLPQLVAGGPRDQPLVVVHLHGPLGGRVLEHARQGGGHVGPHLVLDGEGCPVRVAQEQPRHVLVDADGLDVHVGLQVDRVAVGAGHVVGQARLVAHEKLRLS